MLNFKEWQESREFTLDLDEVFDCPGLSEGQTGLGYVYGAGDWVTILSYIGIIDHGEGYSYYLTISNGDWVSKNLEELEERLYHQWVVTESDPSGQEIDEMILDLEKLVRVLKKKQLR